MYSRSIFAFLFLIGLSVAGCSSNSTEPANTITPPGVGSTFTFHDVHLDEGGATLDDSSSTYTIAQTAAGYGGRTDAVIAVSAANDSAIFAYTPTGITVYRPEIDIFGGLSMPADWVAVDTTNSQLQTIYDHKDTIAYSGTSLYFTMHSELQKMADTSIMVGGKLYSAFRWRTHTTVDAKVAFTGQTTTAVVDMYRAFAPEIGFYVSDATVSQSNSPNSPVPNGSEKHSLTAFQRK